MKTLYVGNQPDPADRTKILVDDDAYTALFRLISSGERPFVFGVFDHTTGEHVLLGDEDCGLGCRCALKFLRLQ
jgi:hypothetical protein